MKKFIYATISLLAGLGIGYWFYYPKTASSIIVTDLSTFVPESGKNYTVYDTLITSKKLNWSNLKNTKIGGTWKVVYTGTRNKIIIINNAENVMISGGEVSSDSCQTISCMEFWYCKNITISNCKIYNSEWGLRSFYDTAGVVNIIDNEICNTKDDGIYFQNLNGLTIAGNYIHDVNTGYSPEEPDWGGDCIQIAGKQGYLNIYNNVLDHSSTDRKFCLIIGNQNSDYSKDSAYIHDNIMIGRDWNLKRTDAEPNNVVYIHPLKKCRFVNNKFYDGSAAIHFASTSASNQADYEVINNFFSNQKGAISLSTNANNVICNNYFENGYSYYITGSSLNDYFYRNVFISNSNLNSTKFKSTTGTVSAWDENLYDPVQIPWDYGCSKYIMFSSKKQAILDTITINRVDTIIKYKTLTDTVQIPVFINEIDSNLGRKLIKNLNLILFN